jgi:hypothetical protein
MPGLIFDELLLYNLFLQDATNLERERLMGYFKQPRRLSHRCPCFEVGLAIGRSAEEHSLESADVAFGNSLRQEFLFLSLFRLLG